MLKMNEYVRVKWIERKLTPIPFLHTFFLTSKPTNLDEEKK